MITGLSAIGCLLAMTNSFLVSRGKLKAVYCIGIACGLTEAVTSTSVRSRSLRVMRPSTLSTTSWRTRQTDRIEQSGVWVQNWTVPAWRSQKRASKMRPPSLAMTSPTLICSAARASV